MSSVLAQESVIQFLLYDFFLLNCWCEEREGEERGVRDGARWQDTEAMWDVGWDIGNKWKSGKSGQKLRGRGESNRFRWSFSAKYAVVVTSCRTNYGLLSTKAVLLRVEAVVMLFSSSLLTSPKLKLISWQLIFPAHMQDMQDADVFFFPLPVDVQLHTDSSSACACVHDWMLTILTDKTEIAFSPQSLRDVCACLIFKYEDIRKKAVWRPPIAPSSIYTKVYVHTYVLSMWCVTGS